MAKKLGLSLPQIVLYPLLIQLKEEDNYNIFLADYSIPNGPHPIHALTNLAFGDARYPSQYNNRSFSYISNENGINNRYVGM